MRIVSEAKKHISMVWGAPSPKDSTYRLLRYLVRETCNEGTLLFNVVTGELVLLDDQEDELLKKQPIPYVNKIDELIAHHYLVPESYDEAKSVNQIRSILRMLSSRREITGYSILPTTACNAHCFYCYESSYPKLSMTPETADKIVDYIAANCGEDKCITIQWFGGEPTLAEERIDQICEGLLQKGIKYTSSALSNGYLFTKDLVHKAKEKWKLQRVQITMDGTEDIYNKSKAYVNAKGSPYQTVLENIGHLLDEGISVIVRMNLDFHNADDLKALIDVLIEHYAKNDSFIAYVSELSEDVGYSPVSHSEDDRRKLAAVKTTLNQYIETQGCGRKTIVNESDALPCLRTNYCMADSRQSLLINPIGQFGKCDHYSYTRLVGDINTGHNFNGSEAKAWLFSDYTEWCKACSVFPVCGQPEFCVGKRKCYPEELHHWLEGIKAKMRTKATHNKEETNNEKA